MSAVATSDRDWQRWSKQEGKCVDRTYDTRWTNIRTYIGMYNNIDILLHTTTLHTALKTYYYIQLHYILH